MFQLFLNRQRHKKMSSLNHFYFFVFALAVLSGVVSQSDPGLNSPYRLPRNNVNPHQQNLFLQLDLSDWSQDIKYEGYLEIYMYLEEPLRELSFNVHEIHVNWEHFAVYEIEGNNNIYVPANWTHRAEHQITDVVFDTELQIGRHRAEFNFTGIVRTDQSGLYRSNYTVNGETRHLITTHMEPAYARSVFPGFDEPRYITRINLTVAHNRPNYHVISNMPIAESNIQFDNGYVGTRFEQTPHMPQYLLALLISDYESQSSANSRIKTYAPAHLLDQVHYSVDFGERALSYLENWLGRQYQLPKVDFAAIQHFTFGAMENWGLITYRSSVLMYDIARPLKTIVTNIQSQAGLIVHEFAHMWFGNEVTPVFWHYVWLSEGFAQYFQYMGTAELETLWQMREQFVVRNTQSALSEDDHLNVRAMSGYIDEPSALANMFNYVVYGKSSSIIHMISELMGVDAFRRALYSYIDERINGTEPQYLYSHLQRAIDNATNFVINEWPAPMAMIFDSWAENQGYPLVEVTRDYGDGSVTFSQTRYLSKPEERATVQGSSQFYIPVTLRDRTTIRFNILWLTPANPVNSLRYVSHGNWLLVNVRQTGYYRVNYDEANWNMLIDQLHSDHSAIPLENRAQLIDDAASLANAELLDYRILLDILSYLRKETEYIPWLAASRSLTQLERRLRGSSIYKDFEMFMVKITSSVYQNTLKIDNQDYSHVTRLHRVNSLDWACKFGNTECQNDVNVAIKNIVDNIDENPNLPFIPYEIRTPIFCAASKYTDEPSQFVNYLQSIHDKWTDQAKAIDETRRVLNGMGCSQNARFLELLLLISINGIPNSYEHLIGEQMTIFDSVARGSYLGTETALQFILYNFPAMSAQYSDIHSVFSTLAPYLVTRQLYDKFEEINLLHSERYNEATRASVAAARSTALQLLAWSEKHNSSITNWLTQQDFDNEPNSAVQMKLGSIFLWTLGTFSMFFVQWLL